MTWGSEAGVSGGDSLMGVCQLSPVLILLTADSGHHSRQHGERSPQPEKRVHCTVRNHLGNLAMASRQKSANSSSSEKIPWFFMLSKRRFSPPAAVPPTPTTKGFSWADCIHSTDIKAESQSPAITCTHFLVPTAKLRRRFVCSSSPDTYKWSLVVTALENILSLIFHARICWEWNVKSALTPPPTNLIGPIIISDILWIFLAQQRHTIKICIC